MGIEHKGDELTRVLSKRDIFVLAFGAMIGWGWIIQTGYWINEGGTTGAILAFVIGSVMVVTVGLIYSELASAMPFVGGEHVYSLRALGPAGSFVCTWAIILGYVSVVIFEAIALPSALAYLVPGFNVLPLWTIAGEPVYATWVLAGGIGAVVMTVLNYRGVRPAAQFQTILTLVIGLAGLTLVIGALFNGHSTATPPFTETGWSGLFTVIIMTPFMFVGFDVIPQAAGEADVSYRSLGRLIVVSVVMAAAFYISVIWASGQALSGAVLVESPLPAAAALSSLFNNTVIGRIMALAGIAGILTSWNSFIIGGSRAMYALAEANMLPNWLATLHPQYGTPSTAIVLIGTISVPAPLLGEQMLVWIVNAGSFGIVLAWLFVVISFLILRYREPELDRPFKLPGGYTIGVIGLVLTMFFVGLYLPGAPSALSWPFEWLIIFAWSMFGVLFYQFSGRPSEDTMMEDAEDAFESLEN